ncbi:hypothetical protein BKA70DRAFT_1288064 [Coprinopsis sp. MPI-PUGE-AT-0042]|nr:hypothetical protein BKA70DRAFT_1288064 [Coprinopsis sp. MPI-PUGE-AT-0042]
MGGDLDWDICTEEPAASSGVNDGPLSFPPRTGRAWPTKALATVGAQEIPIAISTIFHPDSADAATAPNCAVKSSDGVLFYLNADVLSAAGAVNLPTTPAQEGWLITNASVAQVPETSAILTVILCAVYGTPCDSTTPSIDDISNAIDRMPPYGLSPKALIQKGTPLYTLLMTHHVPIRALAVYTIAAHHDIEALARDASAHLLSLEVDDIDDASAVKIGSTYFMRLILLSTNRIKALKCIVRETKPAFHALPVDEGEECDKRKQEEMRNLWVCTVTQFTWDARSDLSADFIRQTCFAAARDVPCSMCKKCWDDCVEEVIIQWSQIKVSILLRSLYRSTF